MITIPPAYSTCWGQEILVYQKWGLPGKYQGSYISHTNSFSTWGVSVEQVVSREELETERGCEESRALVLPSLDIARNWLVPLWHYLIWNLRDERWSEADTMDALREAGLVTFLDLKMIGSIRQYPGRTWSLRRLWIFTQQVETGLDCIGEAEGWREEAEVAILRLQIQRFNVNCFFSD